MKAAGIGYGLAGFLLAAALRAAEPAGPAIKLEFTDASLHDWVQPVYPPEAIKAKQEGEVTVQFIVEADGHVTHARVKESTNAVFDAAAVQAVSQWVFSPALDEAKPVASGQVVLVRFTAAQWTQKRVPIFPTPNLMPEAEKLAPAKVITAPDPDYPAELEDLRLPGEVQMEFTVDTEGRVREPHVLWASDAAFVEAALRALDQTRFEPAHQGLVPKPSIKRYPVRFSDAIAGRRGVLEACHLEVLDEPKPNVLPQPFVLIGPVYPRDRLLAGEGGEATVEFKVADDGKVSDATITASSSHEFGAALVAAVDSWLFRPAVGDGGTRISSRMRVVYPFVPPTQGPVARLAEALRPAGAGVAGPKGLEGGLKPLWRGFPVYPAAIRAEAISGEAEIEFIIDRGGRVRLPRVKTASREEFGWAAATAISQWVFEPPRRNGEVTDVAVSIAVSFTPPKE